MASSSSHIVAASCKKDEEFISTVLIDRSHPWHFLSGSLYHLKVFCAFSYSPTKFYSRYLDIFILREIVSCKFPHYFFVAKLEFDVIKINNSNLLGNVLFYLFLLSLYCQDFRNLEGSKWVYQNPRVNHFNVGDFWFFKGISDLSLRYFWFPIEISRYFLWVIHPSPKSDSS